MSDDSSPETSTESPDVSTSLLLTMVTRKDVSDLPSPFILPEGRRRWRYELVQLTTGRVLASHLVDRPDDGDDGHGGEGDAVYASLSEWAVRCGYKRPITPLQGARLLRSQRWMRQAEKHNAHVREEVKEALGYD